MSDLIDVKIFIMPSGDEVDLELPVSSSSQDIISSLLEDEELNIARTDSETGENITYRLMRRGKGGEDEEVEVDSELSLGEQGINGYAVFTMIPDVIPG